MIEERTESALDTPVDLGSVASHSRRRMHRGYRGPMSSQRVRHDLLAGLQAGEFDLDGLDHDLVLEFLLHGYVAPCFHHPDPETAVVNVQQLFRRTVGATS
jgi:hypothetical protein